MNSRQIFSWLKDQAYILHTQAYTNGRARRAYSNLAVVNKVSYEIDIDWIWKYKIEMAFCKA